MPKQHQKQGKFLILLPISAAFLVLLFVIVMPWAVESALARRFSQDLRAYTVLVDIEAASFWRLLGGRSDSIELMMEFDESSLLMLSSLRAQWGPSNVALGLMRQGRGGERDAEPNYTELYWDEARLADYLNWVQADVLVNRVEISDTQVAIYGSIEKDGLRGYIYLDGRPKSDDLGRVVFPANEWRVDNLEQTEQLQEWLNEALSFQPSLSPLNWKVWAKQVELSPGFMLVYGSSSCCR